MSSVQSVIDHYPLSAYVDWAANRNRDPILDVFKQLFPLWGSIGQKCFTWNIFVRLTACATAVSRGAAR
jgi:hypothetical protein